MRGEVVERLSDSLPEEHLDAIVCLSPAAVAHAAGFVVPSQPLMRWRHAAIVISDSSEPSMLCVDMEESTVREASPGTRLEVWNEFGGDAMVGLANLIRERGAEKGRVGIELGFLSVADYRRLCHELPDAELVGCDELLARIRQHKTADELELLKKLSQIADGAILDAFRYVHAGSSEMDLAAALTHGVYARGGQSISLMIVATGERSQLPNVGPSERTLEEGDICRVEIFPVIDGYHAGVCRTAVVGRPPAHALDIYGHLVKCRQDVIDHLVPGTPTSAVYAAFRKRFDELKMPPISFVGHGIGVELHEEPYLAPFDKGVVEKDMVFGLDPLVYKTGYGYGMQVKDMVAIGDSGAQVLSDVSDADELFVIEP